MSSTYNADYSTKGFLSLEDFKIPLETHITYWEVFGKNRRIILPNAEDIKQAEHQLCAYRRIRSLESKAVELSMHARMLQEDVTGFRGLMLKIFYPEHFKEFKEAIRTAELTIGAYVNEIKNLEQTYDLSHRTLDNQPQPFKKHIFSKNACV